ncbi:MAG: hypothetical protein J07HX64_00247 [halophilic archaeon J07HX64]|nr:MAG: hypothetical protein J07HX64_00247 [halophilic archaeon J07HX64]
MSPNIRETAWNSVLGAGAASNRPRTPTPNSDGSVRLLTAIGSPFSELPSGPAV